MKKETRKKLSKERTTRAPFRNQKTGESLSLISQIAPSILSEESDSDMSWAWGHQTQEKDAVADLPIGLSLA